MPTSRVIVQLEEVTNTCFVVMPFHALYEAEYERVIKPAIEDAGLLCVREMRSTLNRISLKIFGCPFARREL